MATERRFLPFLFFGNQADGLCLIELERYSMVWSIAISVLEFEHRVGGPQVFKFLFRKLRCFSSKLVMLLVMLLVVLFVMSLLLGFNHVGNVGLNHSSKFTISVSLGTFL